MTSFNPLGRRHRRETCRRDFLKFGAVGLASLGLHSPTRSRLPGVNLSRDRSVILLFLLGGPSQLETWDPKPDAPADVRGPFGTIETQCPGVRISEHLPQVAARMNKLAIIRSVHHEEAPIHETGCQLLQAGRLSRLDQEHPHFGSVIAALDGAQASVPPFVVVPGPITSTGIEISHGQSAGWLGSAYEPFHAAATTAPAAGVAAFQLQREPEHLRDLYGQTSLGQSCLLARRLVEAGVRVVVVNMFTSVFNQVSWDCHGSSPFSTLSDQADMILPAFDRAFAALVEDLEQRGRLETTLVVAAGEFGRTPRLNEAGGRDHWPGVWSVALAGGGVQGGRLVGASDAHAAYPLDRPITPPDLLATIYRSLGVDETVRLHPPGGEPFALVEDGAPVTELFG